MRALSRFFFKLKWYKLSRLCNKGEYTRLMLAQMQNRLEKLADVFEQIADIAKQYKGGLEDSDEENKTAQGD